MLTQSQNWRWTEKYSYDTIPQTFLYLIDILLSPLKAKIKKVPGLQFLVRYVIQLRAFGFEVSFNVLRIYSSNTHPHYAHAWTEYCLKYI